MGHFQCYLHFTPWQDVRMKHYFSNFSSGAPVETQLLAQLSWEQGLHDCLYPTTGQAGTAGPRTLG